MTHRTPSEPFLVRLQHAIEADDSLNASNLATRAGLSNSAIRQMFEKDRSPRAATMRKICAALGTTLEDFMTDGALNATRPRGFSESTAEPFTGATHTSQVIRALARKPDTPTLYKMTRDAPAFYLLAGDLLVVDLKAHASTDDLVLATLVDDTGSASTLVWRYAPPWLLPASPGAPARPLDDSGSLAIVGVIVGSLRGAA